ncbi:MAG: flagellar hook-associated protein FlgK [Betaproteobacteria bacterium TMED82]|nr:MAG: flagellar hook-associated protein FlgK [Betaproteobacteria bacterium TMED82]|tara:strand:- start:163805 stop:167542 length:3738 start_codon:yes stop_codon:yes gene_type:complete
MSDINSIASGAVSNYQRALATVANNIANVDSEGYSRQEVSLAENTPTKFGKSFFGTGARLDGVRRLYDEFIENSLRNSSSELNQQNPMVDYANRVINILGSETIGLTSALDKFFSSARELSTDPASLIQRSVFLSDSEGLTARFKEISNQMDLIVAETEEAINSDITKINVLSEQLATINKKLAATGILSRQPMQLLDERDQLLRELAELAKIKVKEESNGSVNVSLSSTFSSGVIVDELEFERIFATFQESDISKVDLQIGQYTKNVETLSGIGGGNLGGLLSFRKALLEPSFRELDELAKILVAEVNAVHQGGLDLYGNKGGDFFRLNPELTVITGNELSAVTLTPTVIDPLKLTGNDIEFEFDAEAGQVSNLTLDGQYKKGDVIEITLNGSTSKFTIPFLGIEDVGEDVTLEEVRDGLFQFLDSNYGRSLTLTKETDRQINLRSEEFGFFSISPGTLSAEGDIRGTTQRGLWTATDKATGLIESGVDVVQINGLSIAFSGEAVDGEVVFLKSENRPAAGIDVVFDNPALIAAASEFRIIDDEENPSGVNATIDVLEEDDEQLDSEINFLLNNVLTNQNFNEISEVSKFYDQAPVTPISIIPGGYKDIQITITQDDLDKPVNLQLFSRDGNHIAGDSFGDEEVLLEEARLGRELNEVEQQPIRKRAGKEFIEAALEGNVNFVAGSTYINDYLNVQGTDNYRDLDIFYGVKAVPQALPQLGLDHVVDSTKFVVGSVKSKPIELSSVGDGFQEKTFILNGKELTSLEIDKNKSMEASDIRKWLLPQSEELGIDVDAETEIIVESKNITPTGGLVINGTQVLAEETLLSLTADTKTKLAEINTREKTILKLRDAINDQTQITGVGAYVNPDGNLVINNRTGKNIDINGVSASNVLSISAKEYDGEIELTRVVDQVRVFSRDMNFDEGLTLNNVLLGKTNDFADIEDIRDAINDTAKTDYRLGNVFAYLDVSGALVIGTKSSVGIEIAGKNVLNLEARTYQRDFEQARQTLDRFPAEIKLSLGKQGSPADLARMGFDTSLYLSGSIPEDLLVFADGEGSFSLGANYENSEFNKIQELRANPLEVFFVTDTTYQILDSNTGTLLAEREFNVKDGIKYQRLEVNLSGPPKKGDRFFVDGNNDGIGNNQNIIALSDLEKKSVIGGESGLTMSEGYDDIINRIGNFAQRAGVSKEALTVVYDEAVAKRDQVAGVSLDQEAADLVRYQQAYQASAKVMQTASVLFDAIIGIR